MKRRGAVTGFILFRAEKCDVVETPRSKLLGVSVYIRRIYLELTQVVEDLFACVNRYVIKFVFDAQQLVVFTDTICPAE